MVRLDWESTELVIMESAVSHLIQQRMDKELSSQTTVRDLLDEIDIKLDELIAEVVIKTGVPEWNDEIGDDLYKIPVGEPSEIINRTEDLRMTINEYIQMEGN